MSERRLAEVEAIFQAVVDGPPGERERILALRCGVDTELRAYVERLLATFDRGIDEFLDSPASPGTSATPGAPATPSTPVSPAVAPFVDNGPTLPFRVGHYEVRSKLGQGGMGIVYEAEDLKLRRTVALKFLSPGALGSAGATQRFLREARTAAALNHPGVCTVYEVGEVSEADAEIGGESVPSPGTPFIAMERILGGTLADTIESTGAMPIAELVDLALQMAEGLAAAHTHGIVHRDLKPGNVMVTAKGRTKILDFGLAKPASGWSADPPAAPAATDDAATSTPTEETLAEQTRHGVVVGTVAYMSPEQAAGQPVDSRSDVFSFGIILYEMSTGRRPFAESTVAATIEQIVHAKPELPSTLRDGIPTKLEEIIRRCLEKNPDDRFRDADELFAALRVLGDELTGIDRGAGVRRRGQQTRVALVVIALVILAASVSWWWSTQRRPVGQSEIRATRLTALAHMENQLSGIALSPGGDFLAYTHDDNLDLVALETGVERTIVRREDEVSGVQWVDWHPDGERVLSEEWHAGEGVEIWLVDIGNGQRELVHRDSEQTRPRVSPNGAFIALLRDTCHQLWVLDVAGGGLQLLRQSDAGETLFSPVWSPDGRRLAYLIDHHTPGKQSIETCGLDGSRTLIVEREALDQGEMLGTLCWLPDGRLVYGRWVDMGHTSSEFWVVGLDARSGTVRDAHRRLFGFEGAMLRAPTASADGRKLAFNRMSVPKRLMLLEPIENQGEADLRRLSIADWTSGFPVWTRDGHRVFFATERVMGQAHIYVRELDAEREEPFITAPALNYPQCLTPDGSRLLFWQDNDLMSIPVAGGNATRLDRLEWTRPWPIPGPMVRCGIAPATRCVVGDVVGGEFVIRSMNADGTIGEEFLRLELETARLGLEFASFDLSPDGSRIVASEFSGRLRIVDLGDGEVEELPYDKRGGVTGVSWSADSTCLYLTGHEGEAQYWIGRVDLNGESEVLWRSERVGVNMPTPSPDGRGIALGTNEWEVDAWMIEDF